MSETLLNNRYRLLEVIGSGGMAVVYKGVDVLLHRPVAIKILREAYASDPTFLTRFQQEARSAAQLDHPNVVTIYDVGEDHGRHYIVMEYVDGEDLKTLIRREGRLSVERAVNIATQIAAGVGHAHKAGIIHCDVKPQNVLVTREGVAKVADFGIARALSESGLTDSEVVWGSPLYFSPEQAAGERLIPASDVYSIGVVLYEMLAGEPPFQAEKPTALALMHLREEPPPLTSRNPHVPPQLEWIVRKLMSKEPANRYRTADQLAMVLEKYRTQLDQATGFYRLPDTSGETTSTRPVGAQTAPPPAGPDWRTWILGAIATIAVIGLVPLWALVYRAWARSSAPPTVAPLPPTATATVAMVLVPDVQGRLWEDARADIEAAGLRFTLEEQLNAAAPEGTIMRQEPAPGQYVPRGSEVRLFIAGPPQMVTMPRVVDLPVDLARQQLEEAGLQVVTLDPVWASIPADTVMMQQPEEGTQIQAGGVVTLTVSGGTAVPIRVQANLGNIIVLEEAELLQARFRPGDIVALSLRWRALAAIPAPYVVFVHLIGPDGNLVAQEDVQPLQGTRPTTTWVAGLALWDPHQVYLPANAPQGTYQVRVGMYPVGQPENRLTVVDPGQASVDSNSILIAEVEIAPWR